MLSVVAAIISRGDCFLACQRPANKARGLFWEFVGGKVEPGETQQQALARECEEELGITVSVGEKLTDVIYEYPDVTVCLSVYFVTIADGIIQKREHNDIRWITLEDSNNYPFCPADVKILEILKKAGLSQEKIVY